MPRSRPCRLPVVSTANRWTSSACCVRFGERYRFNGFLSRPMAAAVRSTTMSESTKVTIRDVAREAGVSPTTVSRALSKPGRVNLETATKVREVAERLGYRTKNLEPRQDDALRGMILTTTSDLKYSVFADFVDGMQHPCIERGFILLTALTEEKRNLERSTIMRMSTQVDGLVLTSSRLSDSTIRKAAQVRPTVVVNRLVNGVQSVVCDDRPSLTAVVRRLKALGHESVTYIAGPESSWQNGLRWQALLSACQKERMRLRQIPGPQVFDEEAMRESYAAFFDNPTTAVILFNDIFALQFLDVLTAHGVSVPEQVSVVGIDDTTAGTRSTPTLSSIHIPRGRMGTQAATKLIGKLLHIDDGDSTPIVSYSTFVERGSIGPASAEPIV
ncbi:LacI family DNA-binding transcriptional regulator [Bifidobacterium sp. SMB2]|uniref:LacI family DNA-binding transcriptional regulator n=2 Tax=Bifidobacterium TaxID=1678 RepID=A0ABX0C770_9BIFI|nr:LacI family DNA-binding transcriptional regulator [Bifidobacterium sp. SMB2]NEH10993.1 LacI family DNA-binding transcriptional regulator [Bifidobacterium saimiriisciurei]